MNKGIKLSVICPALLSRIGMSPVLADVAAQAKGLPVELIVLMDNGTRSTGEKMNDLYQMAAGDFVSSVADDDRVTPRYVDALLGAIETAHGDNECDAISFVAGFTGRSVDNLLTFDGVDEQKPMRAWDLMKRRGEDSLLVTRLSPLSAFRRDVVRRYERPHISHREDQFFETWAKAQGLVRNHVDEILYHIHYRAVKPEFGGGSRAPVAAGMGL